MAQWLGVLAFLEDPRLVTSTQSGSSQLPIAPAPGETDTLSHLRGHPTHTVIHMQTHTYTQIK